MLEPVIYSIGHSNLEIDTFCEHLQRYQVDTLVDVRSQPYSRWVPAFNRETLKLALQIAGFDYIFMGDQLGGRPKDRTLWESDEKRPDYDRVSQSTPFQEGIKRLLDLANASVVAVMCSEGDYHQCHRGMLITPELLNRGARVIHILPDGRAVAAEMPARQLGLF